MWDVLSRGFKNARLRLSGQTELTEQNIQQALREVRTSLLQADVALAIAKDFIERVKARALGQVVTVKAGRGKGAMQASPQDHFIKACYDELVELLGPAETELDLSGKPAIILMMGLQGSGKTTTSAKLARLLVEQGRKPLLVAADVYRPAAIDQLQVLGTKLRVPVFSEPGVQPVALSVAAVAHARDIGRDVVIIDTAGRLAIDDALMTELDDIQAAVQPKTRLFVVDAMIGQDAVRTAAEFDRRLQFTGFVLTKLDGDARGGSALSIKAVTGKPVQFLGKGESLDALEVFRPEGLAQRILGFGDVVGLMQDFEKHVDQDVAKKDAAKMLKGQFSYDDFVRQLRSMRKMGPIKEIMARMPGISQLIDQIPEDALDDRELDRTVAIIQSMTRQERQVPDLLSPSRMARIAKGCGRTLDEVTALHQRFVQARQLMAGLGGMLGNPKALQQQMQAMQQGGLSGMPGMLPGLGGDTSSKAGSPGLSPKEKKARRAKQKAARKARKRKK